MTTPREDPQRTTNLLTKKEREAIEGLRYLQAQSFTGSDFCALDKVFTEAMEMAFRDLERTGKLSCVVWRSGKATKCVWYVGIDKFVIAGETKKRSATDLIKTAGPSGGKQANKGIAIHIWLDFADGRCPWKEVESL